MVVTFIGHRKLQVDGGFRLQLRKLILALIDDENADIFLFGSRSVFDELCLETVTEIKKLRTHIKRKYVRASYPYIDSSYESYLLRSYDATFVPDKIKRAGKAAYVERNEYMIDKADVCIFYYDENYLPAQKDVNGKPIFFRQAKSGTKIAYDYAAQRNKTIINLCGRQ